MTLVQQESAEDRFMTRWAEVRLHLLTHANKLEHDAGMDGCMHDGGAHALRSRIEAFECGMAHRIPAEWERFVAPLMDPEYADYQRLKAKFERRQG